ncbi:MAG TPA: universal stress protein [Steroidobacteraceae bacterium]|nr:universal stress protein [Steroidobacteraceae bacterium]
MTVRKPLLVPIDGSASSLGALSLACQRVKARRGGSVVALDVQQAMPPNRFATRTDIRDHHERMSAEVFGKVERVAAREKVPVRKVMGVGLAAAVILDQAGKIRADEIVMGTRGLGQIGGLLMGSVAMKVVQLAKVPVTLVK